jgi:hypothetical protein
VAIKRAADLYAHGNDFRNQPPRGCDHRQTTTTSHGREPPRDEDQQLGSTADDRLCWRVRGPTIPAKAPLVREHRGDSPLAAVPGEDKQIARLQSVLRRYADMCRKRRRHGDDELGAVLHRSAEVRNCNDSYST